MFVMIIYSSIPAESLPNTNLMAYSQKYGGKLSILYDFKRTGFQPTGILREVPSGNLDAPSVA